MQLNTTLAVYSAKTGSSPEAKPAPAQLTHVPRKQVQSVGHRAACLSLLADGHTALCVASEYQTGACSHSVMSELSLAAPHRSCLACLYSTPRGAVPLDSLTAASPVGETH